MQIYLQKYRDINPDFVQEGVASWYGPGFQGRKTASGERFNTNEMTAAHKTLPFNTLVKVTNLDNGNLDRCENQRQRTFCKRKNN